MQKMICLLGRPRFGPKSLMLNPRPLVCSWGITYLIAIAIINCSQAFSKGQGKRNYRFLLLTEVAIEQHN